MKTTVPCCVFKRNFLSDFLSHFGLHPLKRSGTRHETICIDQLETQLKVFRIEIRSFLIFDPAASVGTSSCLAQERRDEFHSGGAWPLVT